MSDASEPHVDSLLVEQHGLVAAGQRKVNLIWEYTQAIVAILIVGANLAVWLSIAFRSTPVQMPGGLTDALFVIVGFYYGRTNHAAIGGPGPKPPTYYVGR